MSDADAAIVAMKAVGPRRRVWRRPTLLATAVLVLMLAAWGIPQLPEAHELGSHVLRLEGVTSEHRVLAIVTLAALLFASAAAALPIGGMITGAGGLLLGGFVAGATAVFVAPLGALLLFLVVRRTFGDGLRRRLAVRFEPFLRGFQSDAASYLICLRLMPTPFWLVNISAAVLGVRWSTFLWTTFIGIMPMTFAHAFAGAAIGDLMRAHRRAADACAAGDAASCAMQSNFTDLITPSTVLAFAALGVLALSPVVVRKLRTRRTITVR